MNEQLLKDIQHLIVWYQGREVERCENVQKWLDDL